MTSYNKMEFASLPKFQNYSVVTLDSEEASQAYSSTYSSLDWPHYYIGGLRPFRNVQGFKVLSVIIPGSWYTFNSNNNTFTLQETDHSAVTVTIPQGNYTVVTMVGAFATALSHASPSSFTYVVTYDDTNQKFTVMNSSAVTKPFKLVFGALKDTGTTNPRKYLGFEAFENTSSSWDSTNGDYLLAPFVANVTGPNYLFLNSSKLGTAVDWHLPKDEANLGGGNAGAQICKIPINVNPGSGNVVWDDPNPQYFFDVDNMGTLAALDLFLTIGNSRVPLSLNGSAFIVDIAVIENTDAGTTINSTPTVRKRIHSGYE